MRRTRRGLAGACVLLALAGACGRKDEGGKRAAPLAPEEPVGEPAQLATIPEGASAPEGAIPPGMATHAPIGADFSFVFAERGGGVAFVIERAGLQQVVHNGRAGGRYAAVGAPVLSRDGRHCAYGALAGGRWRMVADHVEGERAFDAVAAPGFSWDGAHLAYQAMDGERWHLVVDGKVNQGTETRYLQHELSADGSKIAFVEAFEGRERGRFYLGDASFASRIEVAADVGELVVSSDRTRVAAVAASAGGGERVVSVAFGEPDRVEKGPAFRSISNLACGPGGAPLVYEAERSGERFAVLDGQEEVLPPGHVIGPLVVRAGGKSLAALMVIDGRIELRGLLPAWAEPAQGHDEAEGLTFSGDGSRYAYAARRGKDWHVVANGRPGPPFDRVVSPQFSPDGRFLVYRARLRGERFVVVADPGGRLLAQHPAYEQVFPVRFASGGRAVAYGVKAGRRLLWKVEPL